MKAVQIYAPGDIGGLRYGEIPEPELQSSMDVLVKLEAAAINRLDLAMRPGAQCQKCNFPRIPGADGAGRVAAAGATVKNVAPGDAVCLYPYTGCGECRFCAEGREDRCTASRLLGESASGTYAEYIRVPAKNCFAMPVGLSFEEAAALPLAYLTAWRMLITHAGLTPGDWVLIMGAGGSVATAALLLAAAIGAHVIVTSSSEAKLNRAKRLGASYGLDYRDTNFAKEVRRLTAKRGVDVVVDSSGGENWTRCLATLARGGRLVTCGAGAGAAPKADLRRVFWNHLKIFGTRAGSRSEFRQLLSFIERSGQTPIIDRTYPLQDARWAQQRLQDGQQFGKIVLRMNP